MKTRLSQNTLSQLDSAVEPLSYNPEHVRVGIVHIGPGAFHRAHQAVYTHELLKLGELGWGICEVSINSAGVRDALAAQDNLYTLAILDQQLSHQVIGSIKEVLVAPEAPQQVISRMAAATTKVVTMTITEKGYCLTREGDLDFKQAAIQHDLSNLQAPTSVIGFLVAALQRRRADGTAPFTAISCDNLANNGARLQRAVVQFAKAVDAELGDWIAREVAFPSTMVDSITPATDESVRESVEEAIGLHDAWPIQREAFTQWVIEDIPGVELPPWHKVGATLSRDVHGYEAAKLRILNGLHSALAFVGILSGLESVQQATEQDFIAAYLEKMLLEEIIPAVPAVAGLDLLAYGHSILARFKNPAIRHLLSQIAWDSSQKIPFRILGTVQDNIAAGRRSPLLCLAVAAWMKFIVNQCAEQSKILDPLASQLQSIAAGCDGSAANDVNRFLSLEQVFSANLLASEGFHQNVCFAYGALAYEPGQVAKTIALMGDIS